MGVKMKECFFCPNHPALNIEEYNSPSSKLGLCSMCSYEYMCNDLVVWRNSENKDYYKRLKDFCDNRCDELGIERYANLFC